MALSQNTKRFIIFVSKRIYEIYNILRTRRASAGAAFMRCNISRVHFEKILYEIFRGQPNAHRVHAYSHWYAFSVIIQ